jgi:uncharacterized repeat protein (TIGR01451 family)
MFLTLAQEKGYTVYPYVLSKWKGFQRAAAQNWRTTKDAAGWQRSASELQQAFRLYTLALAGAPEQGAMNRMKEQANLYVGAKWRLAAAYALTGKTKPAEELTFNAPTRITPYTVANYTYGSSDRDEAMILETLILMKRHKEALEQAKEVSRSLSNQSWFDTQSTAFALMAMGRLADDISGTLDFTWTWNGKQQPAVKSAKALFTKSLSASPHTGKVFVKNQGTGALSVDLVCRTQLLNDTLPPLSNSLRLEVKYTTTGGSPIATDKIKQGTDFTATVSVTNNGTSSYANLALTHILPSGWEIVNDRSATDKYTYQDIRDDRVLTYFDLQQGETKVFTIHLNAAYLGSYILPAIQCEAMYDPSVQARTQAGRTIIN